jgi:UDP-glucose 4-epimerase
MSRATVLGAAGFVGARLAQRLRADGHEVYAPARGEAGLLERDLGVVYYCAGLTADYATRPFDTVEAHASLVSALAMAGRFERFVYLSSTRLYDGRPDAVAREDDPLLLDPASPRHIYDLSKALGENLALTQMGGRGAVARLSNVFDMTPGSPGFLSEWLVRAASERSLDLDSSPGVARDYVHLDDVVAALVAMAGAPGAGIVNVASGELVTNGELAQVFQAQGWQVAFQRQDAPSRSACADIAKLRNLGVDPRPVREVVGDYLKAEAGS